MGGVAVWVNAPICEADWIDQNAEWDPENPQRLLSLRNPVRLTEPVVEQCAWCGGPTIFGVYVRAARKDLNFPPPPSVETSDDYLKARGVVSGTEPTEDVIRRIRGGDL